MNQQADNRVTYFARTLYRNIRDLFGIRRRDRLFHTYIIGKTGAGKSNLLLTLILQDIHNGEGLTVIDPHGDLVERVAASIRSTVATTWCTSTCRIQFSPMAITRSSMSPPNTGLWLLRAFSRRSTSSGARKPGVSVSNTSCAMPFSPCSTSRGPT